MNKIIQKGLVLLVFAVPLVFSHATTEVYGLIKWTLLELGVLALLVVWVIQLINSGTVPLVSNWVRYLRSQSLKWAVLSFFVVALLSLIKASNKYEGVMSLYQLGAGIGLFFLVINNVKEKKEVDEILLAMVLSGLIACFFSFYENRGIKLSVSRLAYASTFGNPIFFAQYLSLLIPISLAMCFRSKQGTDTLVSNKFDIGGVSPLLRIFFGLSALIMLVFVILTRSRGTYLGLSVAFLYVCIVLLSRCPGKLRKALTGLLVICLFAAALTIKSSAGESTRLRNLMRVYLWSGTFKMVKDNPVLGVGTGNFKIIYPLYRSAEEREVTPKGITYSKAHNDFLQIWAETGTLGLVCFLWILFAMLFQIRVSPLRGQTLQADGPSAHISFGLSMALITLLSQALFNPVLYVPVSAMGFWMLAALFALRLK